MIKLKGNICANLYEYSNIILNIHISVSYILHVMNVNKICDYAQLQVSRSHCS